MELTRRQKATLQKLLEIYQEVNEPLHYSVVADQLGVSRFTAYDMLRLLEEKGYVTSVFRLNREHSGPGRSEVAYLPTDKARKDFSELARKVNLKEPDWESALEAIFTKFVTGELPEAGVLGDLLAHIPGEDNERLRYCLEVMFVILIRMQRSPHGKLMQRYLPVILPTVQTTHLEDLALMGGIALGILTVENENDPEWCREMYEHIHRYKHLLDELTDEERQILRDMIGEASRRFQLNITPNSAG